MKKTTTIIILCLMLIVCMMIYASAEEKLTEATPFGMIDRAFEENRIDLGDKIFYDLQAVFEPDSLPREYQLEEINPIKSGTYYVNSVLDNWDLLSSEQQNAASAMLGRPELDSVYISPEGHFAIHYSFVDYDSVSADDLDSNGVSDYVENVAGFADSVYRYYHQTLGYLTPPSDGDEYYDIYIKALPGAYGTTVKEAEGDSSWNDYSSYIKFNCNFLNVRENEDPEGKIVGAQKITCAHEYFHAIQMAYAYKDGDDYWWSEGTAVYMEDVLFTEVNDQYYYLPYFFNYPDTFLIDPTTSATNHDYSTFIWPSYLAEDYGLDIIRTAWEYMRYYDVLPSLDSAIASYGGIKMKEIFPEFLVWNYFTGDRADTAFHDDGAFYPDVAIENHLACPFYFYEPNDPPDGLSSNYIIAYPQGSYNGLLKLGFDGLNSVEWSLMYVTFKTDTSTSELERNVVKCPINSAGKCNSGIYDFLHYDSILFVPCVISQWQDDNDYIFDTSVYPFGDVNGDGLLNLLDITQLINFLYRDGIPPAYDERMGDINCDGPINILDVTYLINTIYKGGPLPCLNLQP